MLSIDSHNIVSVSRTEFTVGGGYNVLINNTLRKESDIVTDAACFLMRHLLSIN